MPAMSMLVHISHYAPSLTAVQWAPSSRHILVSGADDHQALVWDLSRLSGGRSHSGIVREPTLAFNAESEINNLYGVSAPVR